MIETYDFDKEVDRQGTASVKWEFMPNENHTQALPTSAFIGEDRVLPMWVADMDFPTPPEVIEALVARAWHGIFGYTARTDSYNEAVIHWMQRRHGWTVNADWICPTPGVVPALYSLVRTFVAPGEGVLIQPPVYHPFYHAIERNEAQVAPNPLIYEDGRYRMDLDDLAEKVRDPNVKLAILCHPHNPVGRVWSRRELQQFGEICSHHGVIVVSDEIHGDLIYPGVTFTSFGKLHDDLVRNAVICTAPSKTFNLAGLKTSNIIIPNEKLRHQFQETLERSAVHGLNPFGVAAMEAAYCQGEPWLEQLLNYLNENLSYLKSFVSEHIPAIKVVDPQGTYLVWLDCRRLGLDKHELHRLMLDKARVLFDDGFVFGPEGEGFVRMNIACPRAILVEALERMKKAIADT